MAEFLGRKLLSPYTLTRLQRAWSGSDLAENLRVVEQSGFAWLVDIPMQPGVSTDAVAALEAHRTLYSSRPWDFDSLPNRVQALPPSAMRLTVAAVAGATSVRVSSAAAATVKMGTLFAVARKLYQVTEAVTIARNATGVVKFRPGLHVARKRRSSINVNATVLQVRARHRPSERTPGTIEEGMTERGTLALRIE